MAETIITQLRLIGQRAYISGARASSDAIKDIGKASEQTTPGMKLMATAGGVLRTGLKFLTVAAAATAATFTALAVESGKVGLNFNASIEDAQTGMTTLLKGNKKLADQTVAAVTQFAKNAPKLAIDEAISSTQLLIGAGMKAKDAVPTMKAFSDTLSAMGKRPEDLTRMTYAFMQMMSKGQITAEELRGQLGEIFPASKLLAKGLGISMAELAAEMKTGSLKGQGYIQVLIDQMGKEFKGGTERSAKTFNGMINNIKENGRYTLGLVFKPLFTYLEKNVLPMVGKIGEQINKWAEKGGVNRLITAFKSGLVGGQRFEAKPAVSSPYRAGSAAGMGITHRQLNISDMADARKPKKRSFLENIFYNVAKMGAKLLPFLRKFGSAFMDAIAPAKPFLDNVIIPFTKGFGKGLISGIMGLLPLLKLLARGLGWIGTKAAPVKGWIEKIGFLIGYVWGPGKLRIFEKFGWLFQWIGSKLKFLGPIFKTVGRFLAGVISKIWKGSGAARTFGGIIVGLYLKSYVTLFKILWAVTKFGGKVIKTFAKIVWGIVKYWYGLGARIAKGFASITGVVVGAVVKFADAIWGALPGWLKKLLGTAGGLIGKAWSKITGGGEKKKPAAYVSPVHPAATAGGGPGGPAQPGGPYLPAPKKLTAPYLQPITIKNDISLKWKGREVAKAVSDDTADKKARR